MTSPWIPVEPLGETAFRAMRRRAMFDYCKWDPQVGDHNVIARHPLVIARDAWDDVVRLARTLAGEALAAERELAERPRLHRRLGLPRSTRLALERAAGSPPVGAARLIRFDFHFTTEGWRISEANADVPGGLNEASGFPALVGPHYPWATPVGDPTAAYVSAIVAAAGPNPVVALVHATAYSDDQQMMTYVAARLKDAGVTAHLCSPSHLRWRGGRAELDAAWWRGPVGLVVRFFPADWLGGLPRVCAAEHFFAGSVTPLSNPGTSILIQSKRFPLTWDALDTPLPAWRAALPETRHPRHVPWRGSRAAPPGGRAAGSRSAGSTSCPSWWADAPSSRAWASTRWTAKSWVRTDGSARSP